MTGAEVVAAVAPLLPSAAIKFGRGLDFDVPDGQWPQEQSMLRFEWTIDGKQLAVLVPFRLESAEPALAPALASAANEAAHRAMASYGVDVPADFPALTHSYGSASCPCCDFKPESNRRRQLSRALDELRGRVVAEHPREGGRRLTEGVDSAP